ncbi:hypothetical protein EV649_1646 [Kribbella sp. VKM Ac-2569]|uniref:hypothetical protein n=1 Tax=Kribbella sp. VKM Ac-2569 TaxID=2512220 RepID=UPI0010EDA7B1|nr:hypothetical protein [Kribbella sp. VKM Ac-2569]RZT27872.1 hypothetical protein EV649_1646 [Kribbella sp. VKM Ac-2569]
MRKLLTALVVLGLLVVPLRAADAAPGNLVFADEFDGTAIDRTKWAIHSNAEADQCLGNKGTGDALRSWTCSCTRRSHPP